MNESILKSLIHIYKQLDETKLLLEDVINQLGVEQINHKPLPQDIQHLVDVALELTPEQRKSLMRFIESLK
ncbi:hypothetical protein [Tepidibacillus fermentans]|uniref:Uncharacterized protein n=1 Tax=Tepidibacillus fermentans TaxID=1281767 RepID=A0A4R3KL85_9BACI|nr:hypothetical protein [Tepidibacillus fermentans]TCS84584.1 hypothetical protein EDD72_101253 [Tepidibacillus fermentans]